MLRACSILRVDRLTEKIAPHEDWPLHKYGGCDLLLSVTSPSSPSRTGCHFAAGDGFCHLPARLLQLGASSSSVVHSTPTTAGTEYCSTVGVWTAAWWLRIASYHSTTLVACIRWRIYYKLLYFNAHSTHSTLDAALRIWPTNQKRTAISWLHELYYTTSSY